MFLAISDPRQVTSGSRVGESFLDIISSSHITEEASGFLKTIQNNRQAALAGEILATIQSEIIRQRPQQTLPPIAAFQGENGALLLEWIFDNFRIGINLENEENESGWYLASKPSMGGIVASGLLSGIDRQGLIAWLVFFAISRA